MKYFLTILMILFLLGCSRQKMETSSPKQSLIEPQIKYMMDPTDGKFVHFKDSFVSASMKYFFPEVKTVLVNDNLYAVLDEGWINDFTLYYKKKELKTPYHRLFDCDDQTNYFMTLIKNKHYNAFKDVETVEIGGQIYPADGVAVGEVYYIPDSNEDIELPNGRIMGHAVNIFLFYDYIEKRLGYCFYDPEHYVFFIPSDTEKESVFFIKF